VSNSPHGGGDNFFEKKVKRGTKTFAGIFSLKFMHGSSWFLYMVEIISSADSTH
jgi:hypothetical protein